MIRSMTAHARILFPHPQGVFSLEISSRNRKFLDCQLQIPRDWQHFEPHIRQWISETGGRGEVIVRLLAHELQQLPCTLQSNRPFLQQWVQVWQEMTAAVPFSHSDADFWNFLAHQKECVNLIPNEPEEQNLLSALELAFIEAIRLWQHRKEQEGEKLQEDLLSRGKALAALLQIVEENSSLATEKYREKLRKRIEEIGQNPKEMEETIVREVAMLAERVDISEEIVRIKTHYQHFFELLTQSAGLVGDTLDFLVQEMQREWNTLGAKSQSSIISRAVIDAKTELKRIKEQVQNIE